MRVKDILKEIQQYLMFGPICLIILLGGVSSIRFNYNLSKYQIQCFHESVEKDSRYQISVKGDSSAYYLHVVDQKPLHEDSRTINYEYKYFSAFANQNTIITFCVGNIGNTSIYFDIQFYHGIYLEDNFSQRVEGRELEDLSDRWRQMLNMVESNYEIYRNHLLNRRSSNNRITAFLAFMVLIIVIGTIVIKALSFRKLVKKLKEKKIV